MEKEENRKPECDCEEEDGDEELLGWPFKGKAKGIWTFVRIAVSLALVFCATKIEGIPYPALLTMAISAYVLIAYDVVLSMFAGWAKKDILNETFLMIVASVSAMALQSYDEAVFVLALYQLGEFFEDLASDRSKESIENLINDMPLFAHVVDGEGNAHDADPESVEVGSVLKILPGEKVPIDGTVIAGNSTLDTSSLSGESAPIEVLEGSKVFSGSVNGNGVLLLRTEKEFKNSTLSKVLDLVHNEEKKRAKSERFIDKFAKYYTPSAILVALLTFVIGWGVRGWESGWHDALYQACNILIISCPCAIVISVPLAFFISIGRASRYGILIKGGDALENFAKADTFVFDKTGTLTKGKFHVREVSSEEALRKIASFEANSTHPIAVSILESANGMKLEDVQDFRNVPGKGLVGKLGGKTYFVGDYSYIVSVNPSVTDVESPYKVIYMASKDEVVGYVIVSDTVKENASDAMKELKKEKVKSLVMLSGDNKRIAEDVARELSLDRAEGELLPQEKLEKLREIKKDSQKTVYVGDGINDAPALLASDVGVSMGQLGSDAANESADIVIMNDNLETLALTKKISKKTMEIALEDIVLPIAFKAAIMILSFLGISNMYLAVTADTGMTLLMILNDMRLWKKYKVSK